MAPPDVARSEFEVGRLLDHLPRAACIVGRDHCLVATNQSFRRAYPTGQTCHQATHGLDVPCSTTGIPCPVDRCLAVGAPQRCLHQHTLSTGARHQMVRVYPIHGRSGRPEWALTVFSQMTWVPAGTSVPRPVGRSRAFRKVMDLALRVATRDLPVLLLGEPGTGKAHLASWLHAHGSRAGRPLVRLDVPAAFGLELGRAPFDDEPDPWCLSLPWASAVAESVGGGTLLLQEIGQASVQGQTLLLGLIEGWAAGAEASESRAGRRFRLISTSTQPLGDLVREGRFRSDLYYRVAGYSITLPPLRRRGEDLAPLARELMARRGVPRSVRLGRDAEAKLKRHRFPGNLDELDQMLAAAVEHASGDVIGADDLPTPLVD